MTVAACGPVPSLGAMLALPSIVEERIARV